VQRVARLRLPFSLDVGRLVLSLALAIVLYLFAVNETNPETTSVTGFTVVPQPVNVPSGLVATDPPAPVRLRVRAPTSVLGSLSRENFVAQVDASNAQAGDNELPVAVRSNNSQVREATADPPSITLHLEEIQERTLPVRVNLTGQVPTGYQLGQPTSDPPQVTVSGAASVVNRAVEAVVDVNVGGVTVSINGVYTPRVVDERANEVTNLRLTPASVNVSVPITQQTAYKEVGIRPTIQGQPAAGYYLEPVKVNPPTATIVGKPADLEGANFVTTAPVDVTDLSTTVVRTVGVVPPPGTLLLDQSQTVSVTVQVSPLITTTTVRAQPSVINLGSGLTVANQPSQVTMTISGPQPTLSGLGARDFRIVLDVGGRGPGRHDIMPTIQNLPAGMAVESTDPKAVTVELVAIATPTPAATPTPSG
jgi:YbbR domain-containing protein